MRRIGAAASMDSLICGSLENVAVKAPHGPSEGFVAQTIRSGSSPRTTKTAMTIPQVRNHFLALGFMVWRTSALMMALSTLLMISKRLRPSTARIIDTIGIEKLLYNSRVALICFLFPTISSLSLASIIVDAGGLMSVFLSLWLMIARMVTPTWW